MTQDPQRHDIPAGDAVAAPPAGALTPEASALGHEGHEGPAPSARLTDPGFLAFLRARRAEEAAAARARAAALAPDRARASEAGLGVLDELIDGIRAGRDLDPLSLPLLKIAYGRHPEFRPEWHATHG